MKDTQIIKELVGLEKEVDIYKIEEKNVGLSNISYKVTTNQL